MRDSELILGRGFPSLLCSHEGNEVSRGERRVSKGLWGLFGGGYVVFFLSFLARGEIDGGME